MYSADAGDEAESPPATGNKQHKAGKRRNGKEKSFWKVAESCRERLCRAMHFETMLDSCKEDNFIAPDEWLKWSEQEEEGESNGARNLKLLNALALRGRHGLEKLITFLEWEDSEQCNKLAHELQTQTGKTHRRLTPLLWIPSPRSEANPMQSHSGYHNDSLQIECNRVAWSQLYLPFKPADTAEENSSDGTEYGDNDESDDEDDGDEGGRTTSAEARCAQPQSTQQPQRTASAATAPQLATGQAKTDNADKSEKRDADVRVRPEYNGPFNHLLSHAARPAMSQRTYIKSFAVFGNDHLLGAFLAEHELVGESCLRRMKQTTCSCVFTIPNANKKFVIFLVRLNQSDNALLQLHLLYQVCQGTQTFFILLEKREFPQRWLPTHLHAVPGIVKPLMSRSALVLTREDGWQADRSQESLPQWATWPFGLLRMAFKEFFCFYKLRIPRPTHNMIIHVAVNDSDDDFCRTTKCANGKMAGQSLDTLLSRAFLPEPYPERGNSCADMHNQPHSQEHAQPPQTHVSTSSVFSLNPFMMCKSDEQGIFLNECLINLIGGVCITLMKISTEKLRADDDDGTELKAGDISRHMERLPEIDSKQQPKHQYPYTTDSSSSSSSKLQRSTSAVSLHSQDGQEATASSLLTPIGRQNSWKGSTPSDGPPTPTGYGRSLSLSDIAAESATGPKRTARARLGPTFRECIVQKIIEKPEEESREDRRPVINPAARSQQQAFPSSHTSADWYSHINKSNPHRNLLVSWRKPARVVCCMADEECDAYRVLNRTFGTSISPSILHSRPGNPAARLIVCTKAMSNCLYVILCFHGVDIKQLYNEWLPEYEPLLLAAVGLSNLFILLGREMDKMLGSFASLLHSASRELCDDRGALRRDKLEEPLFNGKLLLVNTAEGEASRTTKSRTYAPRVSDKLSMSKTTSVEAVLRSLFRDVDHFVPRTHPGPNQKIQQFNIVAEEIANRLSHFDIGFYSSGRQYLNLHQVFLSAIATGDYQRIHVNEALKHLHEVLKQRHKNEMQKHQEQQEAEMREQLRTAIGDEHAGMVPVDELYITKDEIDKPLEGATVPDVPVGMIEDNEYSEYQHQLVLGVAQAVLRTHGYVQRCNMPREHLKGDVIFVMSQILRARCLVIRSAVASCLTECHPTGKLEKVCQDKLDEFVSSWALCPRACRCSHPCLMPADHGGRDNCLFREDYEDGDDDDDDDDDDGAGDGPRCKRKCGKCHQCNWIYWDSQ